MAEHLSLLQRTDNTEYVDWIMDRWNNAELQRAILRFRERTGRTATIIGYRKSDAAKLKPLMPKNLGEWQTDAVAPGHVWICDHYVVNFYSNQQRPIR